MIQSEVTRAPPLLAQRASCQTTKTALHKCAHMRACPAGMTTVSSLRITVWLYRGRLRLYGSGSRTPTSFRKRGRPGIHTRPAFRFCDVLGWPTREPSPAVIVETAPRSSGRRIRNRKPGGDPGNCLNRRLRAPLSELDTES